MWRVDVMGEIIALNNYDALYFSIKFFKKPFNIKLKQKTHKKGFNWIETLKGGLYSELTSSRNIITAHTQLHLTL